MSAGIMYLPLLIGGLAAMIWGLPAAHRLRAPFDIAAALVALAGIIAAAMGVLLIVIPDFFR